LEKKGGRKGEFMLTGRKWAIIGFCHHGFNIEIFCILYLRDNPRNEKLRTYPDDHIIRSRDALEEAFI
jgi:hypothetical protein